MKCPKCSYTSFDYLQECKKCGEILDDSRKSLNLRMGVPTIFAELANHNEVEDNLDQPAADNGFDEDQEDAAAGEFLLGNKFPETAENDLNAAGDDNLDFSNELELSGLGSMDTMEVRNESEFESAPQKNIVLNDLELSPSFSGDDKPDNEPETLKTGSPSLVGNDPDIFKKSAVLEAGQSGEQQLEDDIAHELSIDDAEIDFDLTESLGAETAAGENDVNNDAAIELELDMDDDESLDDLLADLEKKD